MGEQNGAMRAANGPEPPGPDEIAGILADAARMSIGGGTEAAEVCAKTLTTGRFADHRRAVATAAGVALARAISAVWQKGWTPVDVWEVVRRNADREACDLLVDAIAADTATHSPAAIHPRWAVQVEWLDASVWWRPDRPLLEQWAQRRGGDLGEALLVTIALLDQLIRPQMPQIIAPPGARQHDPLSTAGVDQKILTRVRGLLAKAESTEFPDEAEALSAKAQELMNRHAFERALLDADAHKPQQAGAARLWLDAPYVDAKSHLVSTIATANRCRTVFYPHLGCVGLVGDELDLEITELLVTSLLVQATRAMVAEGSHRFAGTSRTRSFRRAFLISYAVRVGERLAEASVRAHEPEEDDRLLPVLAERTRVVDEAFDAMFPKTRRRRPISVSNGDGWYAGRAAADRADLDIERRTLNP